MTRRIELSRPQKQTLLDLLSRGASQQEACDAVGVSPWVTSPQYHDARFLRQVRTATARGRRLVAKQRKEDRRRSPPEAVALQAEVDEVLRGLVNYSEAAKELGVTREAVRQYVRKGRLVKIDTPAGPLCLLGER